MSKELYLTSKVNMALNSTLSDLPIPAGEAGVNLQVKTTIHNLNDEPVSNCKLYVFLPNHFEWTDTPKGCTLNDIGKEKVFLQMYCRKDLPKVQINF